MAAKTKPPVELRLRVLSAVDYAPGNTIRARIQHVAKKSFYDAQTGYEYSFTWRTISTWFYRFNKGGITSIDNKTRSDKNQYRKVQVNQLAEAINEVVPTMSKNKGGNFVKSTLYNLLLSKGYILRSQLSPTSYYRMVRDNNLLDSEVTAKLRLSFAMQYANELWQADRRARMH
jgi:putative transposase